MSWYLVLCGTSSQSIFYFHHLRLAHPSILNLMHQSSEYDNSYQNSPKKGSISDTIARNIDLSSNNETTRIDDHRREVSQSCWSYL